MLRSFFWSGSELKSLGAKVKWEDVCAPKAEGGLGFRVLKDWNKAAMSNHLSSISKNVTLNGWNRVRSYVIKEHCLWHMGIPATASWTIRKISTWGIVQTWIKHNTRNGVRNFFWLDNWHPSGHLFSRFGDRVVFNSGRSFMLKLKLQLGTTLGVGPGEAML